MEYSNSRNSSEVRLKLPVVELVSRKAPFGVKKVVFSSVTPPSATDIFVVLTPFVTFGESESTQSPPDSPIFFHVTALHVVIFLPYSRLKEVDVLVVAPSFDTSTRRRFASAFMTRVMSVSSAPSVAEVAPLSPPSSFLQWK